MSTAKDETALLEDAKVVIGSPAGGGFKVYVRGFRVGKRGRSKLLHWIEAGSGAKDKDPVINTFGLPQANQGCSTREGAVREAARIFRSEARFREFVGVKFNLRTVKHSTAPTFHSEAFIPMVDRVDEALERQHQRAEISR